MSRANDGVTDTRMVVRGVPVATAGATFSIRNDGHVPFTVHGLDVTDMTGWLAQQQVMFVPGIPDFGKAGTPRKRVTLGPEESATVLWSLNMACRPSMAEGSSVTIETLPFRVSWMGVGTTRELPLELPITFVDDGTSQPPPGADCGGN